jgi:hypothetical protein
MRTSPQGDQPGSLKRMWFRFDWPAIIRDAIERDGVVGLVGGGPTTVFVDGCGVSGFDETDCLALVREQIFHGADLPEVRDRVPTSRWRRCQSICEIISGIRHVEVCGFRR